MPLTSKVLVFFECGFNGFDCDVQLLIYTYVVVFHVLQFLKSSLGFHEMFTRFALILLRS